VERATFTHEGLDLRAPNGTKIVAAASGIVDLLYVGKFYGNCVRLKHVRLDDTYFTYYAHLEKWLVDEGDKVKQGDVIGLADNTGNSSGAHLHLTLVKTTDKTRLRGISLVGCVDPLPYMIEKPEKIL
jgi:murein DD-endopeptidase MepM/ murein hydrolase activator NlpD